MFQRERVSVQYSSNDAIAFTPVSENTVEQHLVYLRLQERVLDIRRRTEESYCPDDHLCSATEVEAGGVIAKVWSTL